MKLLNLGATILSVISLVAGQQQVTSSSTTSQIISQYGSSFKNAGGSVLSDKVNVYVVFYGNWSSAESQQEQSTFLKFVDNISSSPWFNLLKQYNDNNGKSVTGPLNLAAAVNDAGSKGLSLNNTDVHKEIILGAVNSGYLSTNNGLDSNGVYVIMGASDVTDSQFCNTNCGYNSYSDQFQYMFIGYPGICSSKCMPSINMNASPNNSPAMDAAITIFSHEIQDILTDPRNNAWQIQGNGTTIEVADFCSSEGTSQEQFGNVTQGQAGSYNLEVEGSKYLVQTVFDLSSQKCSLG